MPLKNAPSKSVQNISSADIYRLAEPLNSPLSMSEEEFAARSLIIASIKITDADFARKTISYSDQLEFAGQAARLRYAVRLVNSSGQKAAFSNFLLVEPAANVAANPTALKTEVTQDAIHLSWTAPEENINGTKPPNILGYNIYRSKSDKEAATLLNKTPVTETKFSDGFFDFESDYFYFVRTVSAGSAGVPTESLESNIVKLHPVDTFPPSPPAALTIAATPTAISLFFPANPENDIAGYSIYRSTDPNQEKRAWTLMTPKLLTVTTYQDDKVESGKIYYYYVTASDTRGNVSGPSEVVSETVP
jgi:fibronectin type 3 domain-containing protein